MTQDQVKKLGLFSCIAIVAGNMMGSGISLLPANLAAIGSIATIGWAVAIVGALALALVFSKLGTIDPQQGGPIAYSSEVAPILGYQAGFLYFHAGWIGNLAIAIAGVDYLSVFFPVLTHTIPAGITTIIIVWIFTGINLLGSQWISRLVTIGVIALLIPVILTGTVGWFYFRHDLFIQNWNVAAPHVSNLNAIMAAVVLCIWSFIGIESASVNASLIDNPKRNIPLATMIGTIIVGAVYISSSTAIAGMFPAIQVAKSGAPFALASSHMFGNWTAGIVSAVTAFACLASLGSWIMMIAQAAARSAKDGTLPSIFAKVNKKGIPAPAIIITSIYITLLMLGLMIISKGSSTQSVFGEIISITVLFTIIPYFYSALHLMNLGYISKPKAVFQIIACLVACGFCFVALSGSAHTIMLTAVLVIFGSLILYVTRDRTAFEDRVRQMKQQSENQNSA